MWAIKENFFKDISPVVLLLLDESSDIHYGRNNKNNVPVFQLRGKKLPEK
jgi:hypothetical protein